MNKIKLSIILLVIIQIIAFILVDPRGNFSVNDDWFYAKAVNDFNFTNYRTDPLITPSLIGQIWYAKIITKIFGFSLEILRFSTIGLAIISVVALYLLFIELGFRNKPAIFYSALLFLNPLFFYLANSFMTDVPALAFAIFSLLFFAKFQNKEKPGYFLIANLFLIYAIIIRQSFLPLLPLSIIFVFDKKRTDKKSLLYYFLSLALFTALYYFLKSRDWWPPQDRSSHAFENPGAQWLHIKKQIFSIWQYQAFFLLPIAAGFLFKKTVKRKLLKYGLIAAAMSYSLWQILAKNMLFPSFRNTISVYGLGPRSPNDVLTGGPLELINLNQRLFLTLLIAVSAAILAALAVDYAFEYFAKNIKEKRMALFLLLSILSQVAIIFLFTSFDRYYLPIFLFLLIIAGFHAGPKISLAGISCLVLSGLIVLYLTKVSLAEYRLKWELADNLKKSGIAISKIDAGYEWLGWNSYGLRGQAYQADGAPWYIGSLYPDNERIYVISYEPALENYELISVHPYGKILNKRLNLYLHKKTYEN